MKRIPEIVAADVVEYKTLTSDTPPSAEQLDVYGSHGWKLMAIIDHEGEWLIYLMRTVLDG